MKTWKISAVAAVMLLTTVAQANPANCGRRSAVGILSASNPKSTSSSQTTKTATNSNATDGYIRK